MPQDSSDTKPPALPEVVAFVFDGEGGAQSVGLDDIDRRKHGDNTFAFAWVHLQRDNPQAAQYLADAGLDSFVIEALTAEETRPRCTVHGDGALVNLRGVNLNPGSEPEDMISARLWIEEKRVIGVWIRPLRAVGDLFDAINRNQAPRSPGGLVATLALRLADRAEPVIAALNEKLDRMEEQVLKEGTSLQRKDLAHTRHTAIILRRYMFPQRDALSTLEIEDLKWLADRDRSRLREAVERVTRLAEDLDAIRDRAQIVHDQVMDMRAESMNKHMLILSVVAAVFLPLGLLTGLLGINVAGIPGSENQGAFWIVCGGLVLLAAFQIWLFRYFKILG